MEKLRQLRDELRDAQDWCDHNGDKGTGYVSLTVDTLQHWENLAEESIDEADELQGTIEDLRNEVW